MKKYEFAKNKPVIVCYYQGHHSHPVRRMGLKIREDEQKITVLEIREGSVIRPLNKGVVKSYRKDKIAKYGQCRQRVRNRVAKKDYVKTTLRRSEFKDLLAVLGN